MLTFLPRAKNLLFGKGINSFFTDDDTFMDSVDQDQTAQNVQSDL